MNSPMTAPITASVIATFEPEMTNGSAAGKRIFQKVWNALARTEVARSRNSAGVLRRPVAVSTTIGKNATSQAIASFDSIPTPSQTRISGASATLGSDWVAINSG